MNQVQPRRRHCDAIAKLSLIGVFSLAALGCVQRAKPGPVRPLTPQAAAEARRTIVAWLECEECTDGELAAVKKLGSIAVPTLAATLREGPPPANLETLRRHLAKTYQKLKEYERTHPESKVSDEATYVRQNVDAYVSLYKSRAATGLGAIGGSDAKRALQDAAAAPHDDVVKSAINEALGKL